MIKFLGFLLFVVSVNAAPIGDFQPETGLIPIIRDGGSSAVQISAIYTHYDTFVVLQNGGGRLLQRTDIADTSTTQRQLNSMNGCGDIEGATQFGAYNLYVDETTPAKIYLMPPPELAAKCTEAIETATLTGMDETSGSFGIEGVSVLQDGRIVVVKETSPERVAVFDWLPLQTNYTPVDLFQVRADCQRLGDVAVRDNGNILVICKTQKTVQEYTVTGEFVGQLSIPQFSQPEGLTEKNGKLYVVGEPNEYQVFSSTPPVYEVCTISGQVSVDIVNNKINDSGTVTCPSTSGGFLIDSTVY